MSLDAAYFRRQAARCRRLVRLGTNPTVALNLADMADEYEVKAREQDKLSKERSEPAACYVRNVVCSDEDARLTHKKRRQR